MLSYVKAILAASERLDELPVSLSGETEPRLTFVLSDTLHPDVLEDLLVQFDDARATVTLEVLAELACQTQVLFFTHHRHLCELAAATLPPDAWQHHELGGS